MEGEVSLRRCFCFFRKREREGGRGKEGRRKGERKGERREKKSRFQDGLDRASRNVT